MARKKAAKREREESSSESSSKDNDCVNQGEMKQKTYADSSSALMIAGSYLRQKVQKQGLKWCSSRRPSKKNTNTQCAKEPAIIQTPLIQEESYSFAPEPEPVSVSQSEPCYSTEGDFDQQRSVFVNAAKSPMDEGLSFSSLMNNPVVSDNQLQLEEDDLSPTRIFGPADAVDTSSLTVVSQQSLQQQKCLPLCVNYDSNSNSSAGLESFRLGNQQLPPQNSIPFNEGNIPGVPALKARQTVDLSNRCNVAGVHHENTCSKTSFLSNNINSGSTSQEDTLLNEPLRCFLPSVQTGALTTVQEESLPLFFGGNQELLSQGLPSIGMPRVVSDASKQHEFAILSKNNNTIWE